MATLAASGLIAPPPGSRLSDGTVTFTWTAVSGATNCWLDVGTALGQGNKIGDEAAVPVESCRI
jgi:hypothetical protein